VDSSAWAALHKAQKKQPPHPLVAAFRTALTQGQLRGSDVVKLEMLHNARNKSELERIELELDEMPTLSVTGPASRAAVGAIRELAASSTAGNPVLHRVPSADALIAATAWHAGCAILHYDGHFDRLSSVLNVDSCWIATPGSI
jgi:predicted nucleic acid-binding protein